jgi:hypothetical protein
VSYEAYTGATTWLYEQLTAVPIAGVSGVYEDNAPAGATDSDDVWIQFELLVPGDDVAEVAEQNIWTDFTFIVHAIARGRSTVALADIASAIYARLHRTDGVAGDARVLSSVRQRPEHDNWTEMGIEYRSLGGVYSLIVQPA